VGIPPPPLGSTVTGETNAYYRRIHAVAQRIRGTTDIGEIVRLLDQALGETHLLHDMTVLADARSEVRAAETRIARLRKEVDTANSLLRIDHLTNVLNRRGLEEAYRREAARASRSSLPLAVALLDLDNFKRLNDTEGHPVGDRALAHVAATLRDALRPQDLIARYGGEEFALLLPDTDTAAALTALARVRTVFGNRPLRVGRRKLPLTFSAGVTVRTHAAALPDLIATADKALYAAKRAGKDRVHAA